MISRTQLRRLALRSSRSPELRPVLQDALLETYPEAFTSAIDVVERSIARSPDNLLVVLFDVSSLSRPRMHAGQRFPVIAASGSTPAETAQLYTHTLGRPYVVAYVAGMASRTRRGLT